MSRSLCMLLVALLAWGITANVRAENACYRPLPSHIPATRGLQPLAVHADDVLKQDLQAAAKMPDHLKAIARLQRNLYTMQHPEVDGPAGWYGTIRCGSSAVYEALFTAIGERVDAVANKYRQERWYLGNVGGGPLSEQAGNQRPGLLALLLMANRFEAFEAEARSFLSSATNDRRADSLFEQTVALADAQVRLLRQWQAQLNPDLETTLVGLVKAERRALRVLPELTKRIDPLRDQHVSFWLQQEAESFERIGPAKDALLDLNALEDTIALQQLNNALRVVRQEREAELLDLAVARGDRLMKIQQFELAKRYYHLGQQAAKEAIAAEAASNRQQAKAQRMEQTARKVLNDMQRNSAEQEAFDDDTDDLARELGIDLDDF